jgi:hypothetical protein
MCAGFLESLSVTAAAAAFELSRRDLLHSTPAHEQEYPDAAEKKQDNKSHHNTGNNGRPFASLLCCQCSRLLCLDLRRDPTGTNQSSAAHIGGALSIHDGSSSGPSTVSAAIVSL